MLTIRERAIAIAKESAYAHRSEHDYLKRAQWGYLEGDFKPHEWVLEAIERALLMAPPAAAPAISEDAKKQPLPTPPKMERVERREVDAEEVERAIEEAFEAPMQVRTGLLYDILDDARRVFDVLSRAQVNQGDLGSGRVFALAIVNRLFEVLSEEIRMSRVQRQKARRLWGSP